MEFQNMHIKDIRCVVHYSPRIRQWSAKNRKEHIMGIMLNGSALHDFGYQNFIMGNNCVYFLNQKDDFDVQSYEPGESISVHFTTYEDIETDSFCMSVSSPDSVLSILQKAEAKSSTDEMLSLRSLVYQLCAELQHIREKAYSAKDKRITSAKEYLDIHFKEPGCLAKAVAATGLTARRFGELFRNRYQTTPNRYILFRKVEYAKNILLLGNLSVAEVAELSGFSDVYYFSKVFKTETGITPSAFRKQ